MKNLIAILVVLCAISFQVNAQESEKGRDGVFSVVEEMPEFPGGKTAMINHISQNVKYPETAKKNGIQGKVYVSFVIDTDGSVTDVKIERGVDAELDREALRVVSELPNWKPGKQRGTLVKVMYTMPIQFALDGKTEKKS